jgi:hypothetical protein
MPGPAHGWGRVRGGHASSTGATLPQQGHIHRRHVPGPNPIGVGPGDGARPRLADTCKQQAGACPMENVHTKVCVVGLL